MRVIRKRLAAGIVFWLIALRVVGAETSSDDSFEPARELFAEAVEDPARIGVAVVAFESLEREHPRLSGRARAYIGALTAMKSRQTRWPHKKLGFLRKGLAMMDAGVELNPDDVETLFVHGVACHAAPRILRRRDDAQRDFRRILQLLPRALPELDAEFVREILDFITSEMKPTGEDRRRVEQLRRTLPDPQAPDDASSRSGGSSGYQVGMRARISSARFAEPSFS
jgi:hypothetical protein